MSDHWPEGSIKCVIELQIVALHKVALVLGHVRKAQLILTSKILTTFIRLSAQLQLWLNLNRCAVHTLWNNGELIKQTYRTQVNTLASGRFWGFRNKKRLNARGFAQEYLCSCTGYRPGRSIERHSKSSSLHSKKIFCSGVAGFLWVTS